MAVGSGGVTAMVVEDTDDMRYLLRAAMELADHDIEIVAEVSQSTVAVDVWRQRDPTS